MASMPQSSWLRVFVFLAIFVAGIAVIAYNALHLIDYGSYLGLGTLAAAILIFVVAENRFDRLETRFDRMEKCCEEVRARLDRIEKRLEPQS